MLSIVTKITPAYKINMQLSLFYCMIMHRSAVCIVTYDVNQLTVHDHIVHVHYNSIKCYLSIMGYECMLVSLLTIYYSLS